MSHALTALRLGRKAFLVILSPRRLGSPIVSGSSAHPYIVPLFKRKTNETTLGISTGYVYDEAGRLVMMTRKGTDLSVIVLKSLKKLDFDLVGNGSVRAFLDR